LTHRCASHPSNSQEKGARGRRSYRPAMRSCIGRQRAGCWATVGPLHRLDTARAAAARGRHLEAASTWLGGFSLLPGCQHGWCWCLGKLGFNGDHCARLRTATGALRRAPSISTHMGRADGPFCGVVRTCGGEGMRQGGYGSRAGSRGGRGSGPQSLAGLCSAV
jgi:hypothetical protein